MLLSRSAPKIERHKTVVPIHKDDVEFSDFDRAIVIAIDESSNSDIVVDWAADRVLRRRKDLVVLVNVQPEPFGRTAGSSTLPPESLSQIDDEAKERCRKILSPHAEKLQRDGFVVKGICLIGNPKEVLVASSNVKKPAMIIMGTHGRGSVKRFLMGSVAEYVLHHSAIPVLIVPNGSGKTSESE
ncbi:adenine nucleotide alpha hydrolases-like protein [Martensiomyces pterosporus]|nr:adenine nucleotide alpha hydrolases-like protein [Martensiomyces pterosporus]